MREAALVGVGARKAHHADTGEFEGPCQVRSAQALAEEDRVGVTGGQRLHRLLRPEFQQGRVVRRDPIGREQRQELDAEAAAWRADGDALSPQSGERDFARRVAAEAPQRRVEEVRCVDDRAGLLGVRGAGREERRIDALLAVAQQHDVVGGAARRAHVDRDALRGHPLGVALAERMKRASFRAGRQDDPARRHRLEELDGQPDGRHDQRQHGHRHQQCPADGQPGELLEADSALGSVRHCVRSQRTAGPPVDCAVTALA